MLKKFILTLAVVCAFVITDGVEAFQSISWTGDAGTFVVDLSAGTWSFGNMHGNVNGVEDLGEGALLFDGSGDASVMGQIFGDQGQARLESNNGVITVAGPIE